MDKKIKITTPTFSKVSKIFGLSVINFIRKTAIITCGITKIETPKAYFFAASFPFSKLIFRAVIFSILGVIEPVKELKKPKRKSKKKPNAVYLKNKYSTFPTATTPVKHPKIKFILVAI